MERSQGQEVAAFFAAFQKKGPIVRVGPNEIGINDIDAVKTVHGYGHNNCDKPPRYNVFAHNRTVNLFCALDAKSQLTIRHRSSAVYSKAFVQSSAHVRRLFSILQTRTLSVLAARAASGEPLDVLSHYVAFSMDFVSSFHFGLSRSTDFLQDVKARDQWLQAYDSAYGKALYWRQEHPFLVSIMRRIGVPLIPESYYRHVEDFDAWVIPRVNTTEGYLDRSGTGEANTHPEEFPLSTIKSERRCYLSDGPSRMQILLYPSNKY